MCKGHLEISTLASLHCMKIQRLPFTQNKLPFELRVCQKMSFPVKVTTYTVDWRTKTLLEKECQRYPSKKLFNVLKRAILLAEKSVL